MTKFIEKRNGEARLPDKDIVVLYHHNCADGFGGAFAAWKKFGDNANYISTPFQNKVPEGLEDKEVYSIDVSFSPEHTAEIVENNKSYIAIDHHITSEKSVKMAKEFVYEMNHSGAVLAWNYFNPGTPLPKIFEYIEDFDLWRFALPNTREIFAYLDMFDFNFQIWDEILKKFDDDESKNEIIEKGKTILQYQNKLIDRLVQNNAVLVKFEGKEIYVLNTPRFQSQAASILANRKPPMAIAWFKDERGTHLSFRSVPEFDVSVEAKKYGGGGHKTSCGATLPPGSKLPWE